MVELVAACEGDEISSGVEATGSVGVSVSILLETGISVGASSVVCPQAEEEVIIMQMATRKQLILYLDFMLNLS